ARVRRGGTRGSSTRGHRAGQQPDRQGLHRDSSVPLSHAGCGCQYPSSNAGGRFRPTPECKQTCPPRPPETFADNLPGAAGMAGDAPARTIDAMNETAIPRVLVVDDAVRLRALLVRYLEGNGFATATAGSGRELDQQLKRHHVDAIVLDLMLPGEDGLAICRRLRGRGDETPIVMLTARGDEVDRIVGLEIGADDYLGKPGSPRELVARLRAILRRGRAPAGAPKAGGTVEFGTCILDLGTRELRRDGVTQRLTTGEFAVLAALVGRPRQPLTRDQLMSLARGREHDAYDRSMDVMISRLRKLVEHDPRAPRYLQTVWGTGYVFVPDGER